MNAERSGTPEVRVSIATTEAEREECCALRYRIYVDELQRPSPLADHDRKLDRGADDATGIFFCARIDGVLVGTVRVHAGAVTGIPPFMRRICGLPQEAALPHVATIRKLAIDPRYRGGPVVVELLRFCMDWLASEGREEVQQVYICAFPHMVMLYRMLGFRPIEPMTTQMSETGPVVPMVARSNDLAPGTAGNRAFVGGMTRGIVAGSRWRKEDRCAD